MKLLFLVMLFFVSYSCSTGYPVVVGEISEEVLTENEDSSEYSFELANDTSSNDSLLLHGIPKIGGGGIKGKISKIGTGNGRYIGGIRNRNSGSGVKDPENAKWALIGIGVTFLVTAAGLTAYYLYTSRRKRYTKCQIRRAEQ